MMGWFELAKSWLGTPHPYPFYRTEYGFYASLYGSGCIIIYIIDPQFLAYLYNGLVPGVIYYKPLSYEANFLQA